MGTNDSVVVANTVSFPMPPPALLQLLVLLGTLLCSVLQHDQKLVLFLACHYCGCFSRLYLVAHLLLQTSGVTLVPSLIEVRRHSSFGSTIGTCDTIRSEERRVGKECRSRWS